MSVVRMNITLPEELAQQLNKLIGPRKKSHFITETLKERIERIQDEELQKMLEEGYKVRKKEGQSIAEEFESADLEGWDEY
jgi:metal-responsive CopG/Arc/MetJ family transcriptional regulator